MDILENVENTTNETLTTDYTMQLETINNSVISVNNDIRVCMYLLAIILSYIVVKSLFKRS